MTAEEYLNIAYNAFENGDFNGAIENLTKAIEINPEYAEAYNNRGNAKKNLLKYQEAIADYNKAIEINPKDAVAYYNRGNTKYALYWYQEAIADYDKAIEFNLKYADAYFNRGNIKGKLFNYHGAIEDFTKAIEFKHNFTVAYGNRGVAKFYLLDYTGAIEDYNKFIEIDKNDALVYYNRGNAKFYLLDYAGAIEDFTKAIKINPDYGAAYNNRGNAKNKLLYHLEAIKDYNKAIEINHNDNDAFYNWGASLIIYKIQNKDESIFLEEFTKYKKASETINDTEKFLIKGIIYFLLCVPEKAIYYLKKSKKDIIEILVSLDKENREKIIDTEVLYPLLDKDNDDARFFRETTKNIDKKELNEYKKVYILSILIISQLHINNDNEKLMAYYTKKLLAQKMLFKKKDKNDKEEEPSKFRLNAINYSNDPTEGKTLLKYLFEEKYFERENTNTEYGAFAGCFTFNHDSLNQFRLYGKEDDKEGTGVSLVFRDNFFSEEAKMAMKQLGADGILTGKEKEDKEEKHALFRCIYIDPTTKRIETVGHKEEYLFHRENNNNPKEIEDYNKDINDIINNVRKNMSKLKELIKELDKDIIAQLLINLRYLTKDIAFKEEQECRIVKIYRLNDEKAKIQTSDDFKQMYVEYEPKVSNHIETIYFGPKATGMELFQDMLKHNGLNISCKKSKNPLA